MYVRRSAPCSGEDAVASEKKSRTVLRPVWKPAITIALLSEERESQSTILVIRLLCCDGIHRQSQMRRRSYRVSERVDNGTP